jgi:hypothetical protein
VKRARCLVWLLLPLAIKLVWLSYLLWSAEGSSARPHLLWDLEQWLTAIENAHRGRFPLVEFQWDYPPGALLLHLPLFLVKPAGLRELVAWYALFAYTAECISAILLNALLKPRLDPGARRCLVFVFLLLPTSVLLNPVRFDMALVVVLFAALLFVDRGRWATAGALLGLGTSVKIFPAFLLAALVLDRLATRERARAASILIAGCLSFLAVQFAYAALAGLPSPGYWLHSHLWVLDAAPRLDSLPGILRGFLPLDAVRILAQVVTVALLVLALFFHRADDVLRKFALLVVAVLCASSVYSPQYQLWLVPWLLLLIDPNGSERRLIVLIAVLEASNVLVFPTLYGFVIEWRGIPSLGAGETYALFASMVVIRAAALIWIGLRLLRSAPPRGV